MKKTFLRFLSLVMVLSLGFGFAKAADATTYTSNVTLGTGENASTANVTIDGTNYDAVKVGTSKAGGTATITVPANTTTLTLHAAAWKAVNGLKLTITGATANPSQIELTPNVGVTGNSPFTVTPDNGNEYFTIDLSGVTAETTLTFTTSDKKRFVMWGVNAETSQGGVTVTRPTFNPDGGLVNVGTTVAVSGDAGNAIYVATEAQLGTSTPTADEVVAAGSNTNSITINDPGTYFAVAVDGQKTSSVAKATFDVLYNDGTEEHPYTVEEAIKVANAAGATATATSYYVHGYVVGDVTVNTVNSDESYTFNMVDSEDLSGDPLKAFKVTSDEAMSEGDIVTVCGPLCMYLSTPEVNTGTVTYVGGKKDAEIAWSADEYTWTVGTSTAADLPTLSNPHSVGIEYTSSNPEVAAIADNGVVTIVETGETTITATVAVNDNYKVTSVSYTLTVFDPTKIQDVLTVDNMGINGYKEYTYTTDNGLTYKAFAYKQNGIQLNANKDHEASGIVVTENVHGYVVKSIVIDAYATGANLLVIGSNTAYTGTDQIKNANDREKDLGTVIQTIEKSTTGKITITPDAEYKYICICPTTSGACQLTSVTIDWKEAAPVAAEVTVTIGANGYATMYYGEKNLTVPAGVDAYTYRVEGNTALADKTYESGSVIPAGEAVLLAGAAGEYTFLESATAGDKATVNCLRGSDEEDLIEPAANETLYILAKGSQGLGFYVAYPDNDHDPMFICAAHKAYLAVTSGASKAPKYIGLPNGGQSGIVNVIVDGDADVNAPAYNVMGQKVNNDYKGFVIKNGKKMYNK